MEAPELEGNMSELAIAFSDSVALSSVIQWLHQAEIRESEIILSHHHVDNVTRNFPLNSSLMELQENRELKIYSTQSELPSSVIISEDVVRVGLDFGDIERFFELPSHQFVSDFRAEFKQLRAESEFVDLDIPPWSVLLRELEEQVDTSTRDEFERLITAAQIENLGALDEVAVSIIAAAQSGALMYDLSKWGEEVGLGSKATFSRRKTSLQDDGVIYPEKVPIEVGRPRERVHLSDDIEGISLDIGIEDEKLGITGGGLPGESVQSAQSSEIESEEPELDEQDSEILAEIQEEIQTAISSN